MKLRAVSPFGDEREISLDPAKAELGKGGEGTVYSDPMQSDCVAKVFFKPTPHTEQKIEAMLAAPPQNTHFKRPSTGETIAQIAWPLEIVYHAGTNDFAGYTMPRLAAGTAELRNLFALVTRQKYGLQDADTFSTRLYIARNLSAIVSFVHGAGHRMPDLKPDNLQLYNEGGFLCLLDCDGLSIKGEAGRWFHAGVITPEYLAPECFGLTTDQLDQSQDLFALAVILFKLLANNFHPSDGKPLGHHVPSSREEKLEHGLFYIDPAQMDIEAPPSSTFEFLEDETQQLFYRAFLAVPSDRPSAKEWTDHIGQLIQTKQVCVNDLDHDHFSKGCALCYLEAVRNARKAATAASVPTAPSVSVPSQSLSRPTQPFGIHTTWSSPPPPRPTSPPTPPPPPSFPTRLKNLFFGSGGQHGIRKGGVIKRLAILGVAAVALLYIIPATWLEVKRSVICNLLGLCEDPVPRPTDPPWNIVSPPDGGGTLIPPKPDPIPGEMVPLNPPTSPPPSPSKPPERMVPLNPPPSPPRLLTPPKPPGEPVPISPPSPVSPVTPPTPPPPQPSPEERAFFEKAKSADSFGAYEAYIYRYPKGAFVIEAEQAIKRLRGSQ